MAAETVVVVDGVVRCGTGEVCEGGRPFILGGRGGDSSAEVTGRSRAVFCGGLFEERERPRAFPWRDSRGLLLARGRRRKCKARRRHNSQAPEVRCRSSSLKSLANRGRR